MSLQLTMPFNLDVSLCCGQVFLWERRGDWWFGVVGGKAMKVRQAGGLLEFAGADEKFVKRYFSLDHDLEHISAEIGKDEYVKAAVRKFWGLRLIRQDPWECLISFICATYKSVAAIRQVLVKLSATFGETVVFEGEEFHGFPTARRLAGASLRELETCGLGYRAKYVLATSKMVCAGDHNVEALKKMPYDEGKHILLEFPGVGQKVADCVLLFSLDKLEAFPVDVWIKRVLLRHYAGCFEASAVKRLAEKEGLSDGDYARLNAFGREYFGGHAGYAQEYLYHYERCLMGNRKVEKPKLAIA